MKTLESSAYAKLPWYKKMFYKVQHHFTSVDEAYKARPKKWIYNLVFVVLLVGVLLYFSLDINLFDNFRHPNWAKLGKMFEGFIHPNFNYMFGIGGQFTFKTSVVYQVIETFAIALVGTTIASILSIPFGFLASQKIAGKFSIISEICLILIRTFPELLLGYIFIQVFGFGPVTGVAVLSIHSVGMIGKMYSEQLDLISNDPLEALDAVGATPFTRIQYGVVPQIAPNFANVILYRFDLNIRTASILGLVGAGGVGYPISVYSQNEHWSELAAVLYGVILLVIIVDVASSLLRKKLV